CSRATRSRLRSPLRDSSRVPCPTVRYVPALALAAAFDPGCVTELQCRHLPLSTAPSGSNWNAVGMNQVSRTSHLAFRRHVVGRLVDLEIVGVRDDVL